MPILEYCTSLWNPQTKSLIEKIERIRRRATNFVLNNKHRLTPGYINYKTRLVKLNLLPNTYRREMMDITMFLKSKLSPNRFDTSQHFTFNGPNVGRHTGVQLLGLISLIIGIIMFSMQTSLSDEPCASGMPTQISSGKVQWPKYLQRR